MKQVPDWLCINRIVCGAHCMWLHTVYKSPQQYAYMYHYRELCNLWGSIPACFSVISNSVVIFSWWLLMHYSASTNGHGWSIKIFMNRLQTTKSTEITHYTVNKGQVWLSNMKQCRCELPMHSLWLLQVMHDQLCLGEYHKSKRLLTVWEENEVMKHTDTVSY